MMSGGGGGDDDDDVWWMMDGNWWMMLWELLSTITFPGDETPPQFDKPEYVGTLMFDGAIELDTQIKAKDGDAYLDTEVSYALSGKYIFLDYHSWFLN